MCLFSCTTRSRQCGVQPQQGTYQAGPGRHVPSVMSDQAISPGTAVMRPQAREHMRVGVRQMVGCSCSHSGLYTSMAYAWEGKGGRSHERTQQQCWAAPPKHTAHHRATSQTSARACNGQGPIREAACLQTGTLTG